MRTLTSPRSQIQRVEPKKKKGLSGQNPGDVAPTDLLRRDFGAKSINQKWCGDFKEVKTAEGPVFLATVLDLCSRRMVGFATSDDYPTAELAKAAVSTAVATRGGNIDGVVFHSDKVLRRPVESGQFTSVRYTERLDEIGAVPSIGSVGDSYDNALAESVNALYKTELIRGPRQGP